MIDLLFIYVKRKQEVSRALCQLIETVKEKIKKKNKQEFKFNIVNEEEKSSKRKRNEEKNGHIKST